MKIKQVVYKVHLMFLRYSDELFFSFTCSFNEVHNFTAIYCHIYSDKLNLLYLRIISNFCANFINKSFNVLMYFQRGTYNNLPNVFILERILTNRSSDFISPRVAHMVKAIRLFITDSVFALFGTYSLNH